MGASVFSNDDIDDLLEEKHKRDRFDVEFGIEDDVSEDSSILVQTNVRIIMKNKEGDVVSV